MAPSKFVIAGACLLLLHVSLVSGKCVQFSKKYKDAETFITKGPWAGSFVYTSSENAYSMWFSNPSDNPNDKVTTKLIAAGKVKKTDGHLNAKGQVDKCFLDYEHKNLTEAVDNKVHPEQDPAEFKLCKPWSERSCCRHETVGEVKYDKLFKEWYGVGGQCGKISAACRQYWIEEQCFYDCEPAAGLYRKFRAHENHPVGHSGQVTPGPGKSNKWQISGMPIQKAYADKFFEACKNDFFCDLYSGESCTSTTPKAAAATKASLDNNKTLTQFYLATVVLAIMLVTM